MSSEITFLYYMVIEEKKNIFPEGTINVTYKRGKA